ncbi:MAG: hypothetical protein ACYDGY_08150 [Acidimicrobiales bacterium]
MTPVVEAAVANAASATNAGIEPQWNVLASGSTRTDYQERPGTGSYCGIASTPDGRGCWVVDRCGEVYTAGNAPFLGSILADGIGVGADIAGIVSALSGEGYWLYSTAGDVYSFGELPSYGTLAGIGYDPAVPVVSMAAYTDARAYCLLNAEGDVFTFGEMKHVGAPRGKGIILADPAACIMLADSAEGYLIADSGGEIYTFGSAWFHGSLPSERMHHAAPIISLLHYESTSQDGYRMIGADGGVYCFDAPFYGAPVGVMNGTEIVAATEDPVNHDGYFLLSNAGEIFHYDIHS